MAVEPVFVASLATLLAELRLSTLVEGDGLAVVHAEVRAARVWLYQHLGAERIAEIKETAYTENPTTDAGIIRLAANELESKLALLFLRRRLPMQFRDAAGSSLRVWNEAPEGPSRDPFDVENATLRNDIARLERIVLDEDGEDQASEVRCENIEADEAPAPLGSSRWPDGVGGVE